MKTVTIAASKTYDILIGSGLLPTLGAEAGKLGKAKKACIVSETNVWPLYGQTAKDSLEEAGLEVVSFVFPAGEEYKNGATFLELLNFLAENEETALAETAEFLDLDVQAVRDMYAYYDFDMTIRDSDIAAMEDTMNFMLETGMIEQAVDVASLVIR